MRHGDLAQENLTDIRNQINEKLYFFKQTQIDETNICWEKQLRKDWNDTR